MPISTDHIDQNTPMGASLVAGGATFKIWAPNATEVYVTGNFNGYQKNPDSLLNRVQPHGYWAGFISSVKDRDTYKFYIKGPNGEGFKRDPYAKELKQPHPWECVVRSSYFPWHVTGYKTPEFKDVVIYQLHVGTFFTPVLPLRAGTFLDVATKLPYFKDLGITALQLLPIQEFPTRFSLGYNGIDYFSPEMDFGVPQQQLQIYVDQLNDLLFQHGLAKYANEDLYGEMNQLKTLIDLSHIYGIAVMFDVVYNHAGGGFDDESLYFLDFQDRAYGNNNSLYFSDKGHAGGLVFDYKKDAVRSFLIDNARFLIQEYRVDGLRYDQVSVIHHDGEPAGWNFCQDLTSTLKHEYPHVFHLAEYWPVNNQVVEPASKGMGFSMTLTDGLRISIRNVISQAANPDDRALDMSGLADALWPQGFSQHWKFVQGPENHDLVAKDRELRISKLGDPTDPRSWYARSRARVASGLSLIAPGIPMLFMGQEFLEDKQWSDDFEHDKNLLIDWQGLNLGNKQMADHLRFTRELIRVRLIYPALTSGGFNVLNVHNQDRLLIFHRWVPGNGNDIIVVVNLSVNPHLNYRIGFPRKGNWKEIFNSDVYENWVNDHTVGNQGLIQPEDYYYNNQKYSNNINVPANGLILLHYQG